MKICIRKWCQKWPCILFEAIYRENKHWLVSFKSRLWWPFEAAPTPSGKENHRLPWPAHPRLGPSSVQVLERNVQLRVDLEAAMLPPQVATLTKREQKSDLSSPPATWPVGGWQRQVWSPMLLSKKGSFETNKDTVRFRFRSGLKFGYFPATQRQ